MEDAPTTTDGRIAVGDVDARSTFCNQPPGEARGRCRGVVQLMRMDGGHGLASSRVLQDPQTGHQSRLVFLANAAPEVLHQRSPGALRPGSMNVRLRLTGRPPGGGA